LAAWDVGLADILIEGPLRDLLSPDVILQQFTQSAAISDAWRSGGRATIAGVETQHSCLVSSKEIRRRVWRGQVGPLFTFLEERRVELLNRFKDVLRVPFSVGEYLPIQDVQDLEISHIKSQVDAARAATREETFLLGDLKRVRHRLAHLEAVTADDLSRPSLRPWLGDVFS